MYPVFFYYRSGKGVSRYGKKMIYIYGFTGKRMYICKVLGI